MFGKCETKLAFPGQTQLIMKYNLSKILLDFSCYYFVDIFCVDNYERYWCIVFCDLFVCIWYQGNVGLIKYTGKCLFLFYILEEFLYH